MKLYAVECHIRDLVVGDSLAEEFHPIVAGFRVSAIENGPDGGVVVWFNGDSRPYFYDGDYILCVARTLEDVVRDLVRVCCDPS